MVVVRRPSGASIRALKTFAPEKARDCRLQLAVMMAAPRSAVIEVEPISDMSYAMPLGSPLPADAIEDMGACYERLWAARPMRPCDRHEYHSYVFMRTLQPPTGSESEYQAARDDVARAYNLIRDLRITQEAFVHGDATLSNALMTSDGVRLIDLSPRSAPPEIEVDIAKLMFSALGFDAHGEHARRLWNLVIKLRQKFRPDLALLRYYLASHAVRVFLREPPTTPELRKFYRLVSHHVNSSFQ